MNSDDFHYIMFFFSNNFIQSDDKCKMSLKGSKVMLTPLKVTFNHWITLTFSPQRECSI